MSGRAVTSITIDGIAWPVDGAAVAIIRGGRVLIQLRPFPPGWELPGGHCEQDEDPALTAVREAEEETGLHVRIRGVAGVYTWAGLRSSGDVVFIAEVVGGRARPSIEAPFHRFVTTEELPRTAFPWIRRRVDDALRVADGAAPVHRVQPVTLYHVAAFATAWMRAPLDRWRGARRR